MERYLKASSVDGNRAADVWILRRRRKRSGGGYGALPGGGETTEVNLKRQKPARTRTAGCVVGDDNNAQMEVLLCRGRTDVAVLRSKVGASGRSVTMYETSD